MQPPTAPPRDNLTAVQVVGLIQDSPALTVGCGCELLDLGLNVLDDISDDFVGGAVSRSSYATLHGTAQLAVSTNLDWANAIVRPYMTLTDGTVSARFNLGAYFTSTPSRDVEETPPTYDVQGYDILHGLNGSVGGAYAVDAGVSYLAAVEDILVGQGYSAYLIDQTSAATVLPTPRVWVLDDQTKWLNIVNDLLASVGYAGVWSDWDGRLRCQPYLTPRDRAPEWSYEVDGTSMLGPKRTIEQDYFDAPNRWVFYQANNVDGPAPVEGAGIYTYVNQSTGPTSVEARGRVISRVEGLDVADQGSLVQAAQSLIDADLTLKTTLKMTVAPNPLHWHFDRLAVTDPALGPISDVLCTQWTLPLDGSDGSQEWTVL